MQPGIALSPFTSMTRPAVDAGAPADADTIFPPRTTIEPRSMTVPLPTTMRALVMVRSCAASGAAVARTRTSARRVGFIEFILGNSQCSMLMLNAQGLRLGHCELGIVNWALGIEHRALNLTYGVCRKSRTCLSGWAQ